MEHEHPDASRRETTPGVDEGTPKAADKMDLLAILGTDRAGIAGALKVAGIAYAAVWLYAFVSTLLLLQLDNNEFPGKALFFAPAQLVSMAFFGDLSYGVVGDGASVTLRVGFVPFALTVVAMACIWWLTKRQERRRPTGSLREVVSLSVLTGAAFGVLTCLLALVLQFSLSVEGESLSLDAASIGTFVGSLLLTSFAAIVVRGGGSPEVSQRLPILVRTYGRALALHIILFAALTMIGALVYGVVKGGAEVLLVAPVLAGNVVLYALTLGHLGSLEITGEAQFVAEYIGNSTDGSSVSYWLFSADVPGVLVVLLVCAVVSAMLAGTALYVSDRTRQLLPTDWAWAIGAFAVAGLVLTVVARSTMSGAGTAEALGMSGSAGASGSAGPALWTFMLFGAWGLVLEASRRFVGPSIAPFLPAPVLRSLIGKTRPAPSHRPVSEHLDVAAGDPSAANAEPRPASAINDLTATLPRLAVAREMSPEARKRMRRLLVVGGVVAVLGIVVLVGKSVVGSMLFSPDKPVDAVMKAIVKGDGAAVASSLKSAGIGNTILLTNGAYGKAEDRITSYDIRKTEFTDGGKESQVTVDVTQGNKSTENLFTLERTGSKLVMFDEWTIVGAPVTTITVDVQGADRIQVNGQDTKVSTEDGLTVLPGSYVIDGKTGSAFFDREPVRVTVDTNGDESTGEMNENGVISLPAKPNAAFEKEAFRMANALLDTCVASTDLELENDDCPLDDVYGYEINGLVRHLEKRPKYTIESFDGEAPYYLATQTEGQAYSTYTEDGEKVDSRDGSFGESDAVSVSGEITIDGDAMAIEWSNY